MEKIILPLPKKREDISAIVYDYIFYQLGLNIWADLGNFSEEDNLLRIPLHSTIPNRLNPFSKQKKKAFVYNLYNIGEIYVNKLRNKIETATSADKIDFNIYEEFWKLHKHVDLVVRKSGKQIWGKLSYNKTFFAPYFRYIHTLLSEDELDLQIVKNQRRERWLWPLIESSYITFDGDDAKIIPGNQLRAFIDENIDYLDIPDFVVGDIIAQYPDYLASELKIRGFRKYIDVSNTYYFLAVDYGELIPIERKKFGRFFGKFANRPIGYDEDISLQLALNELINAKMLISPNKEVIIGKEEIFDEIMPYRDSIMENTLEITLDNYL